MNLNWTFLLDSSTKIDMKNIKSFAKTVLVRLPKIEDKKIISQFEVNGTLSIFIHTINALDFMRQLCQKSKQIIRVNIVLSRNVLVFFLFCNIFEIKSCVCVFSKKFAWCRMLNSRPQDSSSAHIPMEVSRNYMSDSHK